jgi:Arc/MetJ-type ribon-helix-helix transcriptional regulator
MDTFTVNCSESIKEFVQEEIASGACSSATEVVEKLVHDEKKRRAREKVEALLDKAIASGEPAEVIDQDWQDIREEIQARAARRNGMIP